MNPAPRKKTLWTWLRDTQSNLGAMLALGALLVSIVLAARGYIGLPVRVGALEINDRRQDAEIIESTRFQKRILCYLEAEANNRSPIGCSQ